MGEFKILEKLGLDEPALSVKKYRKMSRDEEREYVRKKYPFVPQSFLLSLDVPRRGTRITKPALQKLQGPDYVKTVRILFQWHHEDFTEEYGIPMYINLNDGTSICMAICPPDVGSPYTVDLIDDKFYLLICSKDPDALARNTCARYMGQWDWEPSSLLLFQHSMTDKTRAPEGKAVIGTECWQPGANNFTAEEWKVYKSRHAQQIMDTFAKVSSNMTWDNVIGYVPLTPFDYCHLSNMAPTGNWGIIDHTPTQLGKNRPVPELARHKTPISGFYATGSAWPPAAGGWPGQGYTCYKVLAEDFGLRKPWEEKGREY